MPDESPFQCLGINHIGLAPKDCVKAKWFLQEALGLSHLGDELVLSQKTTTMMFASTNSAVSGGSRLEILAASSEDSPIAKFLNKQGSGIHHCAISVDNLEAALQHLKALGVRLIDEAPRPGAHSTRIAFVHPESTGGLLIELVQEANAVRYGKP